MNRITNQYVGRALFWALGITVLLGCQRSFGQSVANPNPKKAELIAEMTSAIEVNQREQEKARLTIKASQATINLVQSEVEALKKLESEMSVSAESYPEVLKTLHAQRVQLLIDLAGIDARYQAINKAIDQITKEQAETLVRPLQKLVEIRESELDRLKTMVENGVVSSSDLRSAEIALLESKTRLAQMISPAGGSLGHLNSQLLNTSLERAEKTARLEKANSLIEEVDAYRKHVSKVDGKNKVIRSNKSQIDHLQRQLQLYENELERFRIRLEDINANES